MIYVRPWRQIKTAGEGGKRNGIALVRQPPSAQRPLRLHANVVDSEKMRRRFEYSTGACVTLTSDRST